MSNCPSLNFENYIASEEAMNEAACYETAHLAGFSADEAENCDSGELNCHNCPWAD